MKQRISPPLNPTEDRKVMLATSENARDWTPLIREGGYYLRSFEFDGVWLMKETKRS